MPPPSSNNQQQQERPATAAMSSSATFQRLGGVMATRRRSSLASSSDSSTFQLPNAETDGNSQRPAWMDDLKQTVRQRKADGTLWQPQDSPLHVRPKFIKELKQTVPPVMDQLSQVDSDGASKALPAWKKNIMVRKTTESQPIAASDSRSLRMLSNLSVANNGGGNKQDDDDDDDSVTDSLAGKPEFIRKQRKMNFRKEEAILEACGKLDVDAQQQINLLLRENLATKVRHYNQATNEIRIVRHTPASYQQGLYRPDGADESESDVDPEFIKAQHELRDPAERVIQHSLPTLPQQSAATATAAASVPASAPRRTASPPPTLQTAKKQAPPANSPKRTQPTSYQQSLILKFRKILAGKLDEETRTQVEALLIEALVEEAVLRDEAQEMDDGGNVKPVPTPAISNEVPVDGWASTGSLSSLSTTRTPPQQPSALEQQLLAGEKKAQKQRQPMDMDSDEGSLAGKPEFLRKFRKMNFAKEEHVLEASGCNFMGMSDSLLADGNSAAAMHKSTGALGTQPNSAIATRPPVRSNIVPPPPVSKWSPAAKIGKTNDADCHSTVTIDAQAQPCPPPSEEVGPLTRAKLPTVMPSLPLRNGANGDGKPEFLRKFDRMNFKKDESVLESSGKVEFAHVSSFGESSTRSIASSVPSSVAITADEKDLDMSGFLFDRDEIDPSSHNQAAEYNKARTSQALIEEEEIDEMEINYPKPDVVLSGTVPEATTSKPATIDAKAKSEPEEAEWRRKFRQMQLAKEENITAAEAMALNTPVARISSAASEPPASINTKVEILDPGKLETKSDNRPTGPVMHEVSLSKPSERFIAANASPVSRKPCLPKVVPTDSSSGKPEWMKKFETMQFNKAEAVLEATGNQSFTEIPNTFKVPLVPVGPENGDSRSSGTCTSDVPVVNIPVESQALTNGSHSHDEATATLRTAKETSSEAMPAPLPVEMHGVPIDPKAVDQVVLREANLQMPIQDTSDLDQWPSSVENDDNGVASFGDNDAFATFADANLVDSQTAESSETNIRLEATNAGTESKDVFAGLTDITGGDEISETPKMEPPEMLAGTEPPGTLLGDTLKKMEASGERKHSRQLSRASSSVSGRNAGKSNSGRIERREHRKRSPGRSVRNISPASSRKADVAADQSRRKSSSGSNTQLQQEVRRERRSSRMGDDSRERRSSQSGNEPSRASGVARSKSDFEKEHGKPRSGHRRRVSMDEKTTCSRSSGDSRSSFDASNTLSKDGSDLSEFASPRKSSNSNRRQVETITDKIRNEKAAKGSERSDRSIKEGDDRSRRRRDDRSTRSRDEQSVASMGTNTLQSSPTGGGRKCGNKARRSSSHATLTESPLLEGSSGNKDMKKKASDDRDKATNSKSPVKQSRKKSDKTTKPKDTEELMKFLHSSVNDLSKKKSENRKPTGSKRTSISSRPDKKKKEKELNFSMPVLPMDFTEFDDDEDDARDKEAPSFADPWAETDGRADMNEFDEFDFDDGFGHAEKHTHVGNNESDRTSSDGFIDLHMSNTSEIFVEPSQLSRTTMLPVLPSAKSGEKFDGGFAFSPSAVSIGCDNPPPRGIMRSQSTDLSPMVDGGKEVARKGRRTNQMMKSMSAFDASNTADFAVTNISANSSPSSPPAKTTDKKYRDKSRKKKETVFDTYDWTMS